MLDNISIILISSSKLITIEMDDQSLLIDADGTLRVARSPLAVPSHMTRSVSATRWHRGCGGSPAPSALNATLIRTASWTTRSPSQVELAEKQPPSSSRSCRARSAVSDIGLLDQPGSCDHSVNRGRRGQREVCKYSSSTAHQSFGHRPCSGKRKCQVGD